MSSLKEFPLRHDVLSYIPQKIHYAFSSTEVKLTCFDASSNQLVFGTNAGCAFLYNRESGNIVKLLCDVSYVWLGLCVERNNVMFV